MKARCAARRAFILTIFAMPEQHPLAKVANDVSAAAVLVAACGAVVVGLILLGPALWARLLGGRADRSSVRRPDGRSFFIHSTIWNIDGRSLKKAGTNRRSLGIWVSPGNVRNCPLRCRCLRLMTGILP